MYASLLHVYVHRIDYGLVSVYSSILYHSYPQWGQTALHMASRAGQTAVVKELLDHGANVHAVTKVGRFGVLLDCSVRGVHHVLYILDTYVSVLMAPYYLISITIPADIFLLLSAKMLSLTKYNIHTANMTLLFQQRPLSYKLQGYVNCTLIYYKFS